MHIQPDRQRAGVLTGVSLALLAGIFVLIVRSSNAQQNQSSDSCIGKPYGAAGCPEFEEVDPPATCGDGTVDEDEGEECDEGKFVNGKSASDCSSNCTQLYCGDGGIQQGLGEECEGMLIYIRDSNTGQIAVAPDFGPVCGTYCKAPTCDIVGNCTGGCKMVFGPVCPASSSVAAAQGSSMSVASGSMASSGAVAQQSSAATVTGSGSPIFSSSASSRASSQVSVSINVPADDDTPLSDNLNTCGNGKVETGEQCDDGNAIDTDICTHLCRLPVCGDNVVQWAEECDDGDADNTDDCTNVCQFPACGDGFRQGAEQCDDGNDVQTDECTGICKPPACGDGYIQENEYCDDGNRNNLDLCTNKCSKPVCGDGIRQAGEDCDDGNTVDGDACTDVCAFPSCGNGTREVAEECDDGNNSDADACTSTCHLPICGNSILEGEEECDRGIDNSDVKADACRMTCTDAICGDTVIDTGEECDGGEDCSPECGLKGFKSAAGVMRFLWMTLAIVISVSSLLALLIFRKKIIEFLKDYMPKRKQAPASLDDIPLDQIEMPWHKW